MTIDTPCIKVCIMDDASGLCRGCGRTLEEIGAWSSLNAAARREIMAQLPTRLRAAEHSGEAPSPVPKVDRSR